MKDNLQELILRAQNKEEDAFQQLFRLYSPQIYNYVLKLVNFNHQDAQEIVQETFLNVWDRLYQLKSPEYFPLWVRRIAHNKCIRMFEKNKDILVDVDQLNHDEYVESSIYHNPDKYFEDNTDKQIVRRLVQTLSDKHQQIIDLYYFQQHSVKEIQILLNVTEGTVKSRIFHARKKLKELIESFEMQEQRKINFHMDAVAPSFLFLFFFTIKEFVQKNKIKLANVTQTVAIASVFVFGGLAIRNDFNHKNQTALENNALPFSHSYHFDPVNYKGEIIDTPIEAYYIIKLLAPKKQDIKDMNVSELNQIQKLLIQLKKSQTHYWEALVNSGWIQEYEKYLTL